MRYLTCSLLIIGCSTCRSADASSDKPQCVRLSGHAQRYESKFSFEIVMLGADRYYMKCWHTDPKGLSGFVAIDLVIGDRIGTKSDKWSEDGRRGGGGGPMNSGGKSTPLPVRRLWHDNKIAGAKATELKVRNDAEHYIEEFSNLKPYGDIQLPMKIAWQYIASSMQNDITLYEIENVEFPKNIDEKWFDAKEKEDFNSP